jgi:hypothetical protein
MGGVKFYQIFMGILALNIILFIFLVSVHEMGHFVLGTWLGCESGKAVLLDSQIDNPYTEFSCENRESFILASLGGLIFTLIFSALFLFLEGPGRELFFTGVGLSQIFATTDILIATGLPVLQYIFGIFGLVFIILGEYFTVWSYVNLKYSLPTV